MGSIEQKEVLMLLAKKEIEGGIIYITNLQTNNIKIFDIEEMQEICDIIRQSKNFKLIFINGNKTKITFCDNNCNRMLLEM